MRKEERENRKKKIEMRKEDKSATPM